MAFQNPLNELFTQNDEIDIKKKIVEELFLNNDNLSAKTQLNKPLRWSCLNSIKEFIESHGLKISQTILERFIKTSFTYLISDERKGREEYIRALQALSNIEANKPSNISQLNPIQPN